MPGVWVLRPHLQSAPAIVALLGRALKLLATEPTEHTLWVIDEHCASAADGPVPNTALNLSCSPGL